MPKREKILCEGYLPPWRLAEMPRTTPVLLAFSGGADSRALLELLHRSAQTDGFRLELAHVNHGIRGEEALRDRDFCVRIASEYGLELHVLDVDIPRLAEEEALGIEEMARKARYRYFEELMHKRQIPLLATAHHADDNLETVLFRLCRGTGLKGLGGIPPTRVLGDGMLLVRPLLRCTRGEIETFCEANALQYVTDSTNADPTYARNRIRTQVVPILDTLFEGVKTRSVELADALREDEDYLSGLAVDFLKRNPSNILPTDALCDLAVPIRKRVLRMWFQKQSGCELERVHLDALLDMLNSSNRNTSVALPKDLEAICLLGWLCLLPKLTPHPAYSLPFRLGETQQGDFKLGVFTQKEQNDRKIHNLYTQTCIIKDGFSDIIKKGLYWRPRREGDVILMGGMHRKLRKLYSAANIPMRLRETIPLLCDAEGIVWAPFVGCRDCLESQGNAYAVSLELKILPDCESTF